MQKLERKRKLKKWHIEKQFLFLSSNAFVRWDGLAALFSMKKHNTVYAEDLQSEYQQSILEGTLQCVPAYTENRAICEDFTSKWYFFFQHRENILHLEIHPRRQLTFPLCKPNILHPFYPQSGKHLLCKLSAGGKIQAQLSNWCASENRPELLGVINQLLLFSFKTRDHIYLYNACYNFTWIYMH